MGLLTSLLTGEPLLAGPPSPTSNYWYGDVGEVSQAGPRITDDVALTISAVYACVDKLAKAFKVAPCQATITLPADERGRPQGVRPATDHWLHRLVHDQPTASATAPQFWGTARVHVAMRGAFYARKVFGRGDEITRLDPFHPDQVETKHMPGGRLGFSVTRPGGGPREPLTQDEMFYVLGLTLDGKTPVSVIKYAKETFGLARATEDYAARTFSRGALHRGVVTHPGKLGDKGAKNIRDSVIAQTAGANRWHMPLVLEEGATWHEMTMTPEDTQLLLSRRFSVADVCRWFDVPLVMVHETDRSTSWGSGIEALMIGFVTWAVLPSARDFEAAIYRDLVPESDKPRLRAKFNIDALLRADTAARFTAYGTGIQNGVLAENEARVKEGLDPWSGLWEPRRSANQDRGGDPRGPRSGLPAEERDDDPPPQPRERRRRQDRAAVDPRAQALAESNAQRIVRQEVTAIGRMIERREGDSLRRAIADFYGQHVPALMEALCLPQDVARRYGADHCAEVFERGKAALGEWEREAPGALVALALGRG